MPRTSRLAVGGPAGETTDFDADYKLSPLERMLLTAAVCTEMPTPPSSRALLLGGGSRPPQQQSAAAGGGSAMSLVVQGGYRAASGRSCSLSFEYTIHIERPPRRLQRKMWHNIWTAILASGSELEKQLNELYKARSIRRFRKVVVLSIFFSDIPAGPSYIPEHIPAYLGI